MERVDLKSNITLFYLIIYFYSDPAAVGIYTSLLFTIIRRIKHSIGKII